MLAKMRELNPQVPVEQMEAMAPRYAEQARQST